MIAPYEELRHCNLPFLIAVSGSNGLQIQNMLKEDGQKVCFLKELAGEIEIDRVSFMREFCSFTHKEHMNSYFSFAEMDEEIAIFWGPDSPFFELFQRLDLSHVVELACGHGRHVPQYAHQAGKITLVDILNTNIMFCQERFRDRDNIRYYCNNGYNLSELKSESCTSLFSYDAVVHFEAMDIFEYLKDIYRVLVPGGYVLIHHSNYDSDYRASFDTGIHARSFMSKNLFAYLAYQLGFKIQDQRVIDWEEAKGLDCITLLKKPE